MIRFMKALVAAAGLALFAAGAVNAAPKAEMASGSCEKGVGKAVCCKASVADHCGYVSCCEVGNQGFFTKSSCGACAKKTAASEMAHAKEMKHESHAAHEGGKAAVTYVTCCEMGNRSFYSQPGACSSCASMPACCSAKKK